MSTPDNSQFKFSTGTPSAITLESIEESVVKIIGISERGPSQQVKVYETVEEFMVDFKAGE